MALTFPYPLAFLSDVLRPRDITFDFLRRDEQSGAGDGRLWSAELARPLWRVTLALGSYHRDYGREIDAKLRALGPNRPFLFADPTYQPSGGNPGGAVTVGSVSADRTQLSLAGLPAEFAIAPGDRLSVTYSGRVYLAEAAEPRTATGLGNAALFAVSPFVPFGVSAGMAVEMVKPVVKVIVPPGGHKPYTAVLGGVSSGASLTLLQKI